MVIIMKKIAKIFIALALVTPLIVACTDDLTPDEPTTQPKREEIPIFHETIMPDDMPK